MKKLLYIIFTAYILIVLKLTVFRSQTLTDYSINLSLFTDLINVYRTKPLWQFLRLFFGNLAWFAPLGLILPIITRLKNPLLICTCGFCFSLLIELSQLVLKKGVAELDDLVLNTIGTAIGYAIYRIITAINEKRISDEK